MMSFPFAIAEVQEDVNGGRVRWILPIPAVTINPHLNAVAAIRNSDRFRWGKHDMWLRFLVTIAIVTELANRAIPNILRPARSKGRNGAISSLYPPTMQVSESDRRRSWFLAIRPFYLIRSLAYGFVWLEFQEYLRFILLHCCIHHTANLVQDSFEYPLGNSLYLYGLSSLMDYDC